MSSHQVLSVLLDRDRLRVAGQLAGGWSTTGQLVAGTGLDRRRVLDAVGSLRGVDLVEVDDDRYRLAESSLRRLARENSDAPDVDADLGRGMSEDEAVVLARFFRGRQLAEIPTHRAKRRVVLERLAFEFEIGRRYPEAEVNETLGEFHADVATLRRYLVDEELLDRERGVYWRSGGRTDTG